MPAKGSEIIDLEVQLIHQTDLAWLVRSTDTDHKEWIAKSQAEFESDPNNPRMGTLTIPTWLAQEKELI